MSVAVTRLSGEPGEAKAPPVAAYWTPRSVVVRYLDGREVILHDSPEANALAATHAQWAERAAALVAEMVKRA